MTITSGIDFRASASPGAFTPDDLSPNTYCIGDIYTGSVIRDGAIFGWDALEDGTRDRNGATDRRLQGLNGQTNNGTIRTFKFHLLNDAGVLTPGRYPVDAAIGDVEFATPNPVIKIYDANDLVTPLLTIDRTLLTAMGNGEFVDLTVGPAGSPYTQAQWIASHTPVNLDFPSGILVLKIGAPVETVGRTGIAHLAVGAKISTVVGPTADFSVVRDQHTVTITDLSIAGDFPIETRLYDYDDATEPTLETTHTYSAAYYGTRTITQTVTDTDENDDTHEEEITTQTQYLVEIQTVGGRGVSDTINIDD